MSQNLRQDTKRIIERKEIIMNNEGPLIIIDPSIFNNKVAKQKLGERLEYMSRQGKLLVHVIGADSFTEASDFVFEYLLNDVFSDGQDLNINLIKRTDLIEGRNRIDISSIFYFTPMEDDAVLIRWALLTCISKKINLIFFSGDFTIVSEYMNQRVSIDRGIIMSTAFIDYATDMVTFI